MKLFLCNRYTNRAIAWLLTIATVLGLFPAVTLPVFSVDGEETAPYVMLDGEIVTEVILVEDAKLRFEAVSQQEATAYQWQIQDATDANRWISISGGASQYLWVTYALVGSMLQADNTTQLRCRMTIGDEEKFTDPVRVTLSLNVAQEQQPEEIGSVLTQTYAAAPLVENNNTTYSIVINYLFDNNAIAFEPYGATIAAGSNFSATVKSPTVVGYRPIRRVDNDYIDATEVVLNLTNVQQDITINVIYEPALVNFSVHHHLQNVLDDEYSIHYDLITTSQALTGSIVGEGLALTEDMLPGFRALAYEKLPVAADGSTVIEIRYDRNYYLIDFDMAGGYGTEPVYTRYGALVGANDPVRHGYVFDGWELVSYDGEIPTDEQKTQYALQHGTTIEVPPANLRYKARWITQETTYTMVFWCENPNDSGYSYWGYLDNLPAMSGSYVSAQDLVSRVDGIEDEQYFTFRPNQSDNNVLVEGDGSTVVNVYYTRNYYRITFKAPGKCTIVENHTHTDACYDFICTGGHIHNEKCLPELACSTVEHTQHTDECLSCDKVEHIHGSVGCDCTMAEHSHTVNCWENIGSVSSPRKAPSDPENGYVYRSGGSYYIYINGVWYRYRGWGASSGDIVDPSCGYTEHLHGTDCSCEQEEHAHEDSCYSDVLHTHTSSCYNYSCGQQEHIHEEVCKRLKCGIVEGHSHSSSCKNASSTNTVKTVYAKYGQNIGSLWPVTDDNKVTYNEGQRWDPSNSSYYDVVLVYIAQMPADDFTLTLNEANYKTFTMNYYQQVLPGQSSHVEYNGKDYALAYTIVANYNYVTEAEDFFDIEGFVQAGSNPAFSGGQITTNGNELTVNFYYDRATYKLEFNNNGTVLSDKTQNNIMYQAALSGYDFTPPYPDNLEPNAYTFDGWYTSPGCFDGTEVNWDTLTMPDGDLLLYAKWKPITHTVRVFKDATLKEQIGETQTVDHKAFATAPAGNVTNGNYVFQGWFYMDEVNGEKVEKAFVFNGIPVLDDMDIYAKWGSHVQVQYKVNYKLQGTDTVIADPTVGYAIAGHNKTFDAKAGDQLYAAYQTGYYPMTNSHTITMSVDGTHEFTFYYVYVPSMPYKVQYINADTGEKKLDDKIVKDNSLSVVTETFVRIEGMMPDAYQKRLVLSADNTDSDNDGVYDANVITFYYSSNETNAYYRVVHYIQNIQGDSYREYRSEEMVGVINTTYDISALTLTGFAFNSRKTKINGVEKPGEGSTVTATLPAEGMLIELYYDRLEFLYEVRYLESTTGKTLAEPKTGTGVFGKQIVERAEDLEHIGYKLVSDSAKLLDISANEDHNVIEFLYQEKTVAIRYHVVGPTGSGTLTHSSENVLAINGVPVGSQPIAHNGFAFVGWFADHACTIPVDAGMVDSSTNLLTPTKPNGSIWTTTDYYAKFVALTTDLTIKVESATESDEQTFLFQITGKAGTDTEGISLIVCITGNGSTTITNLPVGDYVVTELNDWSWRYDDAAAKEVRLSSDSANVLTFVQSRTNGKWLDGNTVKDNKF